MNNKQKNKRRIQSFDFQNAHHQQLFFDARVTLRKVADWCRNGTSVASRAPFPRVWVAEEAEELIARRRGLVPS